MALSSCFTCFKISVFVFNFLIWLLGCTLLAVGGWLLTEEDAGRYVQRATSTPTAYAPRFSYSQVTDTPDLATPLAYLFLVSGAALVLMVFIGCCGAVRGQLCPLVTFVILLFVVFIVLLGVGGWSFLSSKNVDLHTPQLQQLTGDTLRNAVRDYYTDAHSQSFMDSVQMEFACCGADNGTDDYLSRGPDSQSPCEVAVQHQPCGPVYFNHVAGHFEDFVREKLLLVACLATAFALCLVVHMLCVLLLCCAVRERGRNSVV
ncbi:CD9 antigen-like [Babylonia areolata]|uniref:CD9 antigen-like n=1 Tax=Babylonia areolata TaxID=304850 RepID=UPI003FD02CF3